MPNTDGSVNIWLGPEKPGLVHESNWLPSPSGAFSVALRIYLPTESVKDLRWEPPRLKTST